MAVCTTTEDAAPAKPNPACGTSARLLANAGEMTLVVRAPRHKDREVRIRSPKCTIGSALGCTLRLRARGVGGLHCWILRGPEGTIVRRLHGPATLNGAQFDEAPVRIGDRLQIGPVELEIVQCNQPPLAQQPMFHPAAEPTAEGAELQSKLDDALLQIKRLQTESRQAFQSSIVAAERADQLRDALALANDQLEEMYKELAASEDTIEKTIAELNDCRRQLAASGAADERDTTSMELARQQAEIAHQEAAVSTRQCELLTAELATSMTAIEKERNSWNLERQELQRVIAQQVAELQAARNNAAEQTCALTIALNEKSAATNATEAELRSKLSELELQLAARQVEVESLQQQLNNRPAQDCAMTIDLTANAAAGAETERLKTKLADLEQQLAASQGEIQSLRQQLESRPVQDCSMTIDLSQQTAAAKSADELQVRLTELQQQLADKQTEIDSLQERLNSRPAQDCAMTIALNEQSTAGIASQDELQAKLAEQEQQLASKQVEIDSLHERLDAHAAVQHRLERLAGEFDAKCRELEQAQSQLAAAGNVNADAQQELEEKAQSLKRQQDELSARAAELAEAKQQFAQQQDQLSQERERLAVIEEQTQRLQQQQSQSNQRVAELEATSAEAASKQAELVAFSEQLDQKRSVLEEQICRLDQQRQEISQREEEYSARLERLEARERELQAAIASQQAAPQSTGGALAEVVNAEPRQEGEENPRESAGVNSVLSRLVKAGLWRDDGTTAEPQEQPEARTPVAEPQTQSPPLAAEQEEILPARNDEDRPVLHPSTDAIAPLAGPRSVGSDEESIESYMDRLMKRVRGEPQAPHGPASTPVATIGQSPSPAAAEAGTPTPASGDQQPASPDAGEFSPRRTAPEAVANMSAMRDLANSAARSAIDRHVRKHTGKQATGRFVGAVLTVALSGFLGYWAWRTSSIQAAAGALIGGGLGAHWLLSAMRRLVALMRLNTPQTDAAEGTTPTAN